VCSDVAQAAWDLLFTRWVRTRRVYYSTRDGIRPGGPNAPAFGALGWGGGSGFPVPFYRAKPISVAAAIAATIASGVFSEVRQPSGCASSGCELTQMIGIGVRLFLRAETSRFLSGPGQLWQMSRTSTASASVNAVAKV